MGNLRSVAKAVEALGAPVSICTDLAGVEKLIIPGVGAFGAAMEHIAPLKDDIRRFAESGQPLMGICLGQQLLFEVGEEHGEHEGLGLLAGRVRMLPAKGLKVPHIGWSAIETRADSRLFEGIESGSWVYFVHSFYTDCAEPEDAAAWTEYGIRFPSAVEKGSILGAQFHPEKSGAVGLEILRRFVEC